MKAFSLIELLIVIAIMAIMVSLSIPAMNSIAQGNGVNRAGQTIGDMIILGRQEAVAKNRDVEVRIINASANQAGSGGLIAVQLWELTDTSARPLSKVGRLPEGIAVSSNASLSPLLKADNSVSSGTTNFGSLGNCGYMAFKIRANGMLSSSVTMSNNFLTIGASSDTQSPPANYYTIRVNPVTGRVNIYRP